MTTIIELKKKYYQRQLYVSLQYNFPLNNIEKQKHKTYDIFVATCDNAFNFAIYYIYANNIHEFENVECWLKLFKINDIIEFILPFRDVPIGIYKISARMLYFDHAQYRHINYTLTNLDDTNPLQVTFHHNANISSIYFYTLIDNRNVLEKIIASLKPLSNTSIIDNLWKSRDQTGNFKINGLNAHDIILRQSSKMIDIKICKFYSGEMDNVKTAFTSESDFSPKVTEMFLYLLYYGEYSNYFEEIAQDVELFRSIKQACEYYDIDQTLKNYIDKILECFIEEECCCSEI